MLFFFESHVVPLCTLHVSKLLLYMVHPILQILLLPLCEAMPFFIGREFCQAFADVDEGMSRWSKDYFRAAVLDNLPLANTNC